MNYRSAMVLGVAREATGGDKLRGLRAVVEHTARGRWADARGPTAQELKATTVLRLDIDEASAKVRAGPALEEEEDMALPVWAGELPLTLAPGAPIADPHVLPGVDLPAYLAAYRRQ